MIKFYYQLCNMQQSINYFQSMDLDKKSRGGVLHQEHVVCIPHACRPENNCTEKLISVGVELLSGDIIRGNIWMMRNASSWIFSAVYMGLTVHYMGF